MEQTNTIKPEWNNYYQTLENIRKSGIINMFSAAPYLAACEGIDENLARQVLSNWMQNYNQLNKQFNWQ